MSLLTYYEITLDEPCAYCGVVIFEQLKDDDTTQRGISCPHCQKPLLIVRSWPQRISVSISFIFGASATLLIAMMLVITLLFIAPGLLSLLDAKLWYQAALHFLACAGIVLITLLSVFSFLSNVKQLWGCLSGKRKLAPAVSPKPDTYQLNITHAASPIRLPRKRPPDAGALSLHHAAEPTAGALSQAPSQTPPTERDL